MGSVREYPDDDIGEFLRRMAEAGDDLSKALIVQFDFMFPSRTIALQFAAIIDGLDDKVSISYYSGNFGWRVEVNRKMIPAHAAVTELMGKLTAKAQSVGGTYHGWGCVIPPRP